MSDKTQITAHSGSDGTPDNSLACVRYALSTAADAFEVDVRRLADGTLALGHDAADHTAPTLREVLALAAAKPGVRINCDLKERGLEPAVAALAADSPAAQMNDEEQGDAFPQFQGKDLDGNDVDNSLFANNAFTVVNFWFNGCKPCVQELDDLNALNERIKAQGGEVVGINAETLSGNEQGIELAKQILEMTGAKYRNIYFDANSEAGTFALGIMAFPTTYVFDRNGRIVGEPLLGSIDVEQNMETLQKLIDQAIAADKG